MKFPEYFRRTCPCSVVYQCVQGSAPSYLQNAICPVASAESRRHHLIVPATPRTTMGAGPRRRSTARLEQSTRRDPSQLIAGHLQTLSENWLLYSVFLVIFCITSRPCFVTFLNWPWSDFFICDTLELANLHYIMVFYSVQADIFDYATESLNNIITVTKNLIFPLAFSWFVLNSPKVLWQLPNYLDFQNDPAFPSKWLP